MQVETIGDAYMLVSGCPRRNGDLHALEIAKTSVELIKKISTFRISHLPDKKMLLRIGVHSGIRIFG